MYPSNYGGAPSHQTQPHSHHGGGYYDPSEHSRRSSGYPPSAAYNLPAAYNQQQQQHGYGGMHQGQGYDSHDYMMGPGANANPNMRWSRGSVPASAPSQYQGPQASMGGHGSVHYGGHSMQQQRVSMQPPPVPSHPRFNPNAPTFVPRHNFNPDAVINRFDGLSVSGHGHSMSGDSADYSSMHVQQGQGQGYGNPTNYGNSQAALFGHPSQSSHNSMVDSHVVGQGQPAYFDGGQPQDDFDALFENDGGQYDDQIGYGQGSGQYVPSEELQDERTKSSHQAVLTEILIGLEQLLGDVDDFGSWSFAIKERILQVQQYKDVWKTAVRTICEMATAISPTVMMAGNPQYILAKLLGYLAAEIPSFTMEGIIPVLKQIHSNRTELKSDRLDERCNLLVFFGEVYDKVLTENGTKFAKFGEAVLQQINDIIDRKQNPSMVNNESMKTVMQIIKLCGYELDSTKEGQNALNDILTMLGAYGVGHPQLSETIKTQLLSLVDLRKNNWGGNRNAYNSYAGNAAAPSGSIVGMNGEELELNDEERDFLEAHFGKLDGQTETETDTSIDDEYDQFLQEEELSKKTAEMNLKKEDKAESEQSEERNTPEAPKDGETTPQ
ncbi:hypothetical protein WR25_24270 [Diploscapter pachys]|uniref:MIF4G domain-containing protein n=1 Tax=Diploscapter pachys TaxID=2018661 RepID=A0A2A2LJ84_9BILA|nr:hypothetical protein WR25_24270 [Diploscapter pachys]